MDRFDMVVRDGIDPPTRGFSERVSYCVYSLFQPVPGRSLWRVQDYSGLNYAKFTQLFRSKTK
jgi:hypothetical protein